MNRYPFRLFLLTKSALHNGGDTRFLLRNDDVIPLWCTIRMKQKNWLHGAADKKAADPAYTGLRY